MPIKVTIDEAKAAVVEAAKVARMDNGQISWKKVQADYPMLWNTLMQYSGGKLQVIYLLSSNMKSKGELPTIHANGMGMVRKKRAYRRRAVKVEEVQSNGHANGHTAPALAQQPRQEFTVKFCPQCAFPLGLLARGMNAISKING